MNQPRNPIPDQMSDADWQELTQATDGIIDVLNDVQPLIAFAALGNVACSIWECYGDQIPHHVMLDWLNQVYLQTKKMGRSPRTKH